MLIYILIAKIFFQKMPIIGRLIKILIFLYLSLVKFHLK